MRKSGDSNARTCRAKASVREVYEAHDQRSTKSGELKRVTAASGSTLLPAIIILAMEMATRGSEIISLFWGHVDLVRRVAHLPATKNGCSSDVPLSCKAVEVSRDRREQGCQEGNGMRSSF